MISHYFLELKSLIYAHPLIKNIVNIETEVVDSNKGWFKARLIIDDHELHVFEFVEIKNGTPCLLKYGYHLQTKSGVMVVRWDTAEHHKEIPTFPYHMHVRDEKNVHPSERMSLDSALDVIPDYIHKGSEVIERE